CNIGRFQMNCLAVSHLDQRNDKRTKFLLNSASRNQAFVTTDAVRENQVGQREIPLHGERPPVDRIDGGLGRVLREPDAGGPARSLRRRLLRSSRPAHRASGSPSLRWLGTSLLSPNCSAISIASSRIVIAHRFEVFI